MGHVVRLELTLDLEGVTKCGEEMDHTIVAAVVSTGANIPFAFGRRSLLEIYKNWHVNRREELPIGNVLVLPAVTATDDVVLLAEGHFTLIKFVARLGIINVLDHETILGKDDTQTHGAVGKKCTKPNVKEGRNTGPKTGVARWDDLTGIVA